MISRLRAARLRASYGGFVDEDLMPASFTRSVRLALWLNSLQADSKIGVVELTSGVEDVDEPHQLVGSASTLLHPDPDSSGLLRTAVPHWRSQSVRAAALLPVPGDAAGLPPEISSAATTAGECLLVRIGEQHLGLVPEVESFGSVFEQGFHVSWAAQEIEPWENRFLGAVGSLPDAERALRRALTIATEAITSLDVARWRPDAAHSITALGAKASELMNFPLALEQRQVQVLTLAARLRAIVALAVDDDGGAVNLWQADQRATALREVDYAARHAISAATFPPPQR